MSEIVAEVESVVLAVPGVVGLYRTGSAVTNLIGAAAERLGASADAVSRVTVAQREGRTEVDIAIGVESGAAAAETAQAVSQRVEAALVAQAVPEPLIRVTIVYVAETGPLG